jgi:hypothetical protein
MGREEGARGPAMVAGPRVIVMNPTAKKIDPAFPDSPPVGRGIGQEPRR